MDSLETLDDRPDETARRDHAHVANEIRLVTLRYTRIPISVQNPVSAETPIRFDAVPRGFVHVVDRIMLSSAPGGVWDIYIGQASPQNLVGRFADQKTAAVQEFAPVTPVAFFGGEAILLNGTGVGGTAADVLTAVAFLHVCRMDTVKTYESLRDIHAVLCDIRDGLLVRT